jgi:type IV pilus assembly protein PilW
MLVQIGHDQRGMTLIELLSATVISSVLILTLSRLIVTEVKIAQRFNRKIQLYQQLHSSLMMIRNNLRQAGFSSSSQQAVFLAGSHELIDVREDQKKAGFIYKEPSHKTEFHHIVYQLVDVSGVHTLRLCEKRTAERLAFEQAAASGDAGLCFSLFDPNWIQVDEFHVSYQPVHHKLAHQKLSVHSGWVSVLLGISLVENPSVNASAHFSFFQRHWSLQRYSSK